MIDFEHMVLLVDGQTEIRSFRKKFTKDFGVSPRLRKVDCNGKNVTPEGYANAAYGTLILTLRGRFNSIICILDRESRRINASQFALQIKKAIINKIANSTRYHRDELQNKINVCIPDRMFENWIISDIEGVKIDYELIQQDVSQDNYDGKSGATILKRIMNVLYKKTLHGPKLFCLTRFNESKKNSPSFCKFTEIIGF
jgi:hypothetical protein